MAKRVILIVLDSVGIGELPDAAQFNDTGSHTLGNIQKQWPQLRLPNLGKLGLGRIDAGFTSEYSGPAQGAYGKAAEKSPGKDTTSGHWEIAGLVPDFEFPYFPQGFPPEIMEPFEQKIGRKTLGNKVASGTGIIDELGPEHMESGSPIIYTSSDSVFQIAMHEEVIPLEEQYQICQTARDLLTGDFAVGRVIARPFLGRPGTFKRTSNRRDYSIDPPGKTVLDHIQATGKTVLGVGKIKDIFAGCGISDNYKTRDNMDGVDKTLQAMAEVEEGLIFVNLVDFDMLYGHRRNVAGYGQCLMEFDQRLPELLDAMQEEDVMILTADHGNDPTHHGTDHTREYIPILVTGSGIDSDCSFGVRESFADIGATVADLLGVQAPDKGVSFLPEIQSN
jgi:phosphopentomutase